MNYYKMITRYSRAGVKYTKLVKQDRSRERTMRPKIAPIVNGKRARI